MQNFPDGHFTRLVGGLLGLGLFFTALLGVVVGAQWLWHFCFG